MVVSRSELSAACCGGFCPDAKQLAAARSLCCNIRGTVLRLGSSIGASLRTHAWIHPSFDTQICTPLTSMAVVEHPQTLLKPLLPFFDPMMRFSRDRHGTVCQTGRSRWIQMCTPLTSMAERRLRTSLRRARYFRRRSAPSLRSDSAAEAASAPAGAITVSARSSLWCLQSTLPLEASLT